MVLARKTIKEPDQLKLVHHDRVLADSAVIAKLVKGGEPLELTLIIQTGLDVDLLRIIRLMPSGCAFFFKFTVDPAQSMTDWEVKLAKHAVKDHIGMVCWEHGCPLEGQVSLSAEERIVQVPVLFRRAPFSLKHLQHIGKQIGLSVLSEVSEDVGECYWNDLEKDIALQLVSVSPAE